MVMMRYSSGRDYVYNANSLSHMFCVTLTRLFCFVLFGKEKNNIFCELERKQMSYCISLCMRESRYTVRLYIEGEFRRHFLSFL